MEESRIWGLLGLVLAVLAVVIIAPEVLTAAGESGLSALGLVVYGVGVVAATIVTVVIILPDLLRSRTA